MFFLILSLNWLFSFIFIFLNHPLSLGCILLIQTILISLSSGFLYFNFWFSYILFLVMIGGMLVMFMYMTSIASNEKFKMPKILPIWIILMIFILLSWKNKDPFYSNIFNHSIINLSQSNIMSNLTLNKFYNWPNSLIMMFLMIYLLITLIAIVKIIGKNFGTLRQK
uniref:NADH dehydrogenase subunit 6 n=1 Tax=Sternochetus gravis TaxID=2987625 RepID=UPI002237B909|nr:NADH dehydrogenase subunit 6 [Sternochetus gravis]UYP50697.1 NADH dehydrogenase subunit 6 [Sternochetus gravis]